jgi:hypothetical protein
MILSIASFQTVRLVVAVLLAVCLSSNALAAEPVDFVREVRPILQKHCYACHAAEKQKSGLRLDIKSEAFKGGDAFGPSIVAGKANESPLVKFVADENADVRMPPEGPRLSPAEIATLTRWVDEGAKWPDGVDLAKLADRRDHWSFKPVSQPQPPATRDTTWTRSEIDRFILARLEQESLSPAPEADRVTWLRRVSFDLVGLPPSPEQVMSFVRDQRSDAYERVVDELLKSPRYGERWAQHWLDVVRYADTHGFEVNTERPHAWPYRDYVISAFNADTPYDRFIREQLVGDALGQDAATGFLVTASVLLPGQIGKDEPSIRLARQDALDEIVVNVGQTFLGLSIGCARCHDHKFDPISARDYYSMQAFVAGVEYGDRELRTPEAELRRKEAKQLKQQLESVEQQLAKFVPLAKAGGQRPPVNAKLNTDRVTPVKAKRVRFTILKTNNLEPCIDELEVFDSAARNVALASAGAKVTSSGDNVVADRHELRFVNDGVNGNSRSWMSNETGRGWLEVELAEEETIERIVWGRDRLGKFNDRLAIEYRVEVSTGSDKWQIVADSSDRAKYERENNKKPLPFSTAGLSAAEAQQATQLSAEKKQLETKLTAAENEQKAFAGTFRKPDVIHLLHRGDPEQPKEIVAPAVLSALDQRTLPQDTPEQERRQALADWIASPQHPLTARVMANRIWQGHFGVGIVETASDFGRTGTKPTHAELLDWLAQEFVRSGWSIKHMHRLIVLSATYRQSTRHDSAAAAKDVDDRWLWRFPSRRLEAEAIRDAMLAVSGQLNLKMGGRGFDLFDKRGGLTGFTPVESFPADGLRRMIYAHKVRREREAIFGAFDCPDAGQSTARRRESTTPIQALNLFNSRFTLERSAAFAARVKADLGGDVDQQPLEKQVGRAYQLALSRDPTADESQDAESVVRQFGLATLCRVLFNSNEFLFLP